METEQLSNTEQLPPDLDAILAKWRHLVPACVDIRIKWEDLDHDEGQSYRAQCLSDVRNNRMLIKVTPVSDEKAAQCWGFDVPRDVEADVVHELLHWRFEMFTPEEDTAEYEHWEAAVERTAQDLLKLDRGK